MSRSTALIQTVVSAVLLLSGCVVAAGSGGGGNDGFFILLVPLIFLGMALVTRVIRRNAQARSPRDGVGEVTSEGMMRAELSVLADDVVRLEPHVALCEAARDDYEAATHRYRVAQVALDETDATVDLRRLQRVIDEANWSMSRVRAILDGRRPPDPPPRLQQAGARGEPAIGLDDRAQPAYIDSVAPFRSGWFSLGGGMFGGLLLGSILDDVGDLEDDDDTSGEGPSDYTSGW
jgi:hypothetical protein